MNQPHCYGLRLVNPYLGVVQVIDSGITRALSRDGFQWEIQIQVERRSGGWGSLNQSRSELQYCRYALWNPTRGQQRIPTDPSLDPDRLQEAADSMIKQLQTGLLECLPFPLQDNYELWLLDRSQLPLALLATAAERHLLTATRERRWQALNPALATEDYSTNRAEPLERLIRHSCEHRQWFHRQADGSGIGLELLCPAKLAGRKLPSSSFPELLVREHWDESQACQWVEDWSHHLAPWLLQLPQLSRRRRVLLERAASCNPPLVESLHRLYPRVIDQQLLTTTRVAAKIATASG
jgi:hypothetical protein